MLRDKHYDAATAVTITLASLASGAARQSTFFNTNKRSAFKATLKITTGAVAPTLGTIVELWVLRRSAVGNADDNVGVVDAAYPVPPTLPRNATLIGSISVTNDANQAFIGTFDSGEDVSLGDFIGFAVANRTDQSLNATAANHSLTVEMVSDDIVQPLHVGNG